MIDLEIFEARQPPERRLIAAVIALALRDACEKPFKNGREHSIHTYARSAHEFIWTPAIDGYLAYLDIEPDFYREKLIHFMSDQSGAVINGFSPENRRAFRFNRLMWEEQRRLFPVVSHDEEEDTEPVQPAPEQTLRSSRSGMSRHHHRVKSPAR